MFFCALDMTQLGPNLLRIPAAWLLGAALVGCGSQVDDVVPANETPTLVAAVASPEAVEAISPLTEVAAKPQAAGDAKTQAVNDAAEENRLATAVDGEGEAPQAAYQPPFPDRIDLFVPPKRQGGMVLKEGGSEDAVELLGFVRLDKQQVVLSINGQVTPIFEGDTQYGIEVISIQPPKVVLQRGRQRWQASLEN